MSRVITRTPVPIAKLLKDAAYIFVGSLIYAIGVDCFEVPNGLAAGGLTGLATIFYAIAKDYGIHFPVGIPVSYTHLTLPTTTYV